MRLRYGLVLAALPLAPVIAQTPFQWPLAPTAPAHAPNVVVIMTDDTGFGVTSAFGGPVPAPTQEALASHGLKFNDFTNTGICSATRAALLTGRNHTNVGIASVTESSAAAPGYDTSIPKDSGTVAEVLKENGYNTAAFGKWHLVPQWEQGAAGPFDHWPTGMGFEHFYGFLTGDTNQFAPALYQDNTAIEPPTNDPSYILDRDLADHATQWIRDHEAAAPDKPFFIYYATGTAHAPFHAPADWIARFKGKFDQGWDALREEIFARQKRLGVIPAFARLTDWPSQLPRWDSLTPDQKQVYAHMMEVYAAAVAYADNQIGRLIDTLKREGIFDNTLIFYIQGDNGTSAEGDIGGEWNELSSLNGVKEDFALDKARIAIFGGPYANNHMPASWANALSTPFSYFKRVPSRMGAVRAGMVVSWPSGIDPAHLGLRSQFAHVIDIEPTILDAAGISPPAQVNGVAQRPLDGISFRYVFNDPKAAGRHHTQFFDISADRAIYSDGWLASTLPTVMPWQLYTPREYDPSKQQWELYDLNTDFSQSRNLAASHPEKLAEMRQLFMAEATKNKDFPLPPKPYEAPVVSPPRAVYRYHGPVSRIWATSAPELLNRSYDIKAVIDVPAAGANGMLVTQGGRFGGYGFYLLNGAPVFAYSRLGLDTYVVRGTKSLAPGRHEVLAHFQYDGGGVGKGGTLSLSVDGMPAGTGRIEATIPARVSLSEGMDIGQDNGTPVSEDYALPFKLQGSIEEIDIMPGAAPSGQAELGRPINPKDN